MNRTVYIIGFFLVLLCIIGYFVSRFAYDSNLYGMSPSNFLVIGVILNLILSVWKAVQDKRHRIKDIG